MKILNRNFRIPLQAELPLLFAILYLPAYLTQGSGFPIRYFDIPAVHLQMIVTSLLYSLLLLYLLENIASPLPSEMGTAFEKFRSRDFFLALAGLSLLYLIINGLTLSFIYETAGLPRPESPILLSQTYMLIPTGISCLFSAAQEELFFRGYGYFRLRQSGLPPWRSMLIISLLFSAGHIYEGIPALFYALGAGLFLTWRIWKGSSLFSLIPAHALINFTIILINFLYKGRNL